LKRPEWIEAVQEIRALWPQVTIGDATIAAWYREVEDLDGDHVRAAIVTWSRDGKEWPPLGGQLRRRVAELSLDIPDWATVLEQLRLIQSTPATRATGKLVESETGADVAVVDHPREHVVARTHPMIVAFFLHIGSQVVVGVDPNDGNAEARLREKWREFEGRAVRRMSYHGLGCGDLDSLRRLARAGGQLRQPAGVFASIANEIARPPALPEGEA